MTRVLKGNKRDIPGDIPPTLWAELVWAEMDQGKTEAEARAIVTARLQEG